MRRQLMLQPALAQDELWVLNETPPSLGRIDLTSFSYEELLSFDNVGYATDLEIQGDMAVVVLENRVVKVDLTTGQMLADVELLGAQEATLLDDGTVVVTRGGLDDAWQPLDLTSFLVWLDADDLGLEGELLPTEGPTLPSQEVMVHNGKVYVAVNNGWAFGQEVGRLGCWDVEEDIYSEWDLGEDAKNPVALHVLDGDLFTVNNGDWSSTSVSRTSLSDLAIGGNGRARWGLRWMQRIGLCGHQIGGSNQWRKRLAFARWPQHGVGRRSGVECGRSLGVQLDCPSVLRLDVCRCDGLRHLR